MNQIARNTTNKDLLEQISRTCTTGRSAALMERLSADLRLSHGNGFSRSNLIYMRLFYLRHHVRHYWHLCDDRLDRN